uniref:Elongation factor Ts, mitochondrial n=1 Tax=Panagrellus redivivus TaxID=6233 RepID=A0A7E4W816_PANRE
MFRLLPILQRSSVRLLSAAAPASAPASKKEALQKLRKRTGYSYTNIRKAVDKFGADDLESAEKWLRKLAVQEGWAKAEKLGQRVTSQGYVATVSTGNKAAVVELNCETDFVARSDVFKGLVQEVSEAVLDAGKSISPPSTGFSVNPLDAADLTTRQNRSVKEAIAMTVGKLGENITVARANVLVAPEGVDVFGRSHPRDGTDKVEMGRYVSVLGIRRAGENSRFPTDKLAAQLCQHVIGMGPKSLGSAPTLKGEKKIETKSEETGEKDELNEFYSGKTTQIDEDETQLLRQGFMLNPSQTVHDYIKGHGAEILAFSRIELGVEETA